MKLPWRPLRLSPDLPAISTSLTYREAEELRRLAAGKTVLEIGSAYGFSTITMAKVAERVVSVDHHEHMKSADQLQLNLARHGVSDKVKVIVGNSKKILPTLEPSQFDMVFIDGDHSTFGIQSDIISSLKLVKLEGCIAAHDYREDTCPEVAPVVDHYFPSGVVTDTLFVTSNSTPIGEPIWSIITLTISEREKQLRKLMEEVKKQIGNRPIEHVVQHGPGTYGEKMRKSLVRSKGLYVSWIDDDDFPEPDYVDSILDGIYRGNMDVITFGIASPGLLPCWQRANRKDNSETPADGVAKGEIVKAANMYCAWRRDLALSAPWLPRNYGAEVIWYNALNLANPHLREHHIHKVLYSYRYSDRSTRAQDRQSIRDSLSNGGNHVWIFKHNDGRIFVAKNIQLRAHEFYAADGSIVRANVQDLRLLKEVRFT